MKGIMKKSIVAKRKIAAVALGAITLVNVFSAAAVDNPAVVNVSYDGVDYSYSTHAGTVSELFSIEGIELKENDFVSYAVTASVEDGMYIDVDVAKYVTVQDEGKVYSAITYATTVAEALSEFGIYLKGYDSCYPAEFDLVYDGSMITISRSKSVTFQRNGEALRYNTYSTTVGEFIREMGLSVSANEELSHDVNTKITDGMTITMKSKAQSYSVARSGNGAAMSPLDFGADLSKAKVLICEATAYTTAPDECGPNACGITASGVKAVVGCVAVDPRVIPLKTKLYIETMDGSFVYGYCVAEDTGGAIKGNKVDLLMNTKSECFQFGRRQVKVYVLPA